MLIDNQKTISFSCPQKTFNNYLKTVAVNDSRFNELHIYNRNYPYALGSQREFNSIFSSLTREIKTSYNPKWHHPRISSKGLEQALIAYMEYRLYYGVN